jgi:type VI secretion system secreted protein VgrG
MERQAAISIALDDSEFRLERLETTERLSELFTITADGVTAQEFDFLPHLGEAASIALGDPGGPAIRYFHGVLTAAGFTHLDAGGAHYQLTIRPWFYLLDQNRDYRIFQNKSVVDIAKAVFAGPRPNDAAATKRPDFTRYVDFSNLGAYDVRDYCVQYKESDFQFLSRLFEQEGIYYYFKHEANQHTLVLCDGKSAHAKARGFEQVPLIRRTADESSVPDAFCAWSETVATTARASVSLRSYNFTTPDAKVEGVTSGEQQHAADQIEVYDYAGDFDANAAGAKRSAVLLDAARARRRVFHAQGDVPGLACGGLFDLVKAEPGRFNAEYLIQGIRFLVDVEKYRTAAAGAARQVFVEAVPSSVSFRPPRVTPKPSADGPETATVAGPDGEVIYVDEHGRVKLVFHWDRRTDVEPGDNSCWVRVSQNAAGAGFGAVDLPRVGQEVIVDFLNGDPDRPIVTGRVYNPRTFHPYKLSDNKTISTWRTQTVGEAGSYDGAETQPPSSKGFNEIRLEDKGGSEEIYVHAQRLRTTEVLLDDKLTVQRDRDARVGRDRTTAVKRNEKLTVETGDETHEVSQGKRTTTIEQDDALTVRTGDRKVTVSQGNLATTVALGNYTLKTEAGEVTVEAMQSITLKVGTSSIVIDQTGVTVKGVMITSEAEAIQKIKGAMTEVEGEGLTTVKGGLVMIN